MRARPSERCGSAVGYFGGGATWHWTWSDTFSDASTATTPKSPWPLIFQSMAPGPGDWDGVAPLASTYLIFVPLEKGPWHGHRFGPDRGVSLLFSWSSSA